mmetsp:Transcript_31295/g.105338  ORF Transcript_31295/g.105338 Transcript_31295/m.105338 type:complete len:354 (-) Transcript_31295:1396-2457(-)
MRSLYFMSLSRSWYSLFSTSSSTFKRSCSICWPLSSRSDLVTKISSVNSVPPAASRFIEPRTTWPRPSSSWTWKRASEPSTPAVKRKRPSCESRMQETASACATYLCASNCSQSSRECCDCIGCAVTNPGAPSSAVPTKRTRELAVSSAQPRSVSQSLDFAGVTTCCIAAEPPAWCCSDEAETLLSDMVPECAPTRPFGVSEVPGELDVEAEGGARNSRMVRSSATQKMRLKSGEAAPPRKAQRGSTCSPSLAASRTFHTKTAPSPPMVTRRRSPRDQRMLRTRPLWPRRLASVSCVYVAMIWTTALFAAAKACPPCAKAHSRHALMFSSYTARMSSIRSDMNLSLSANPTRT